MQLTQVRTLEAQLVLLSGLHIGAGDGEMHIGGTDNPVIKHPHSGQPYIPGSSLKGKIRSLLEWKSGAVQEKPLGLKDARGSTEADVRAILKLFGVSGSEQLDVASARAIGPSRLGFWDCALDQEWLNQIREANQMLTEVKSENTINRIKGVAEHPRNTERVPAGARFQFRLSLKVLRDDAGQEENLLPAVLAGLKLLELDSLGGSGSRGYGKIKFEGLSLDGHSLELPADPFRA